MFEIHISDAARPCVWVMSRIKTCQFLLTSFPQFPLAFFKVDRKIKIQGPNCICSCSKPNEWNARSSLLDVNSSKWRCPCMCFLYNQLERLCSELSWLKKLWTNHSCLLCLSQSPQNAPLLFLTEFNWRGAVWKIHTVATCLPRLSWAGLLVSFRTNRNGHIFKTPWLKYGWESLSNAESYWLKTHCSRTMSFTTETSLHSSPPKINPHAHLNPRPVTFKKQKVYSPHKDLWAIWPPLYRLLDYPLWYLVGLPYTLQVAMSIGVYIRDSLLCREWKTCGKAAGCWHDVWLAHGWR